MARARATRRPGLLSPGYLLRAKAIRSGVFGGSRGWQVVAAVIFGRRLLKKIMGSEPELVATEQLEPGQVVTIRALDPGAQTPRRRR